MKTAKRVTLKVLNERTGGGCSNPSKMPGTSWNISAFRCNVGSKLAEVEGSVCHKCYARKGRYAFPMVQNALERRLSFMRQDNWVDDMAEIINRKSNGFHRWHDSGDLQDQDHLDKIVAIARKTPNVQHWLPTKEYHLIKSQIKDMPENLVVRVSAPMKGKQIKGFDNTSMVIEKNQETPDNVYECPAPTQGGKCGDCRACWDKDVSCVGYHVH